MWTAAFTLLPNTTLTPAAASADACSAPDAAGYECFDIGYAPLPLQNPQNLALADDGVSSPISLGFDMQFYGTQVSDTVISANGFLTFSSQVPGCCVGRRIPSALPPNGLVAAYWTDLNPAAGGSIAYESSVVNNRPAFIVQFTDVPHYGSRASVTFQIQLIANGEIRVHYLRAGGPNTTTAGIESPDGTIGLEFAYPSVNLAQRAIEYAPPIFPDTNIDSGPEGRSAQTSASFEFSSPTGDAFECRLDDAPFAACAASTSYSGLGDGSHSLSVRAVAAGGEQDPTPAKWSWTVDTVAPDTSIVSGPASRTAATDATFAFESTEQGATFECEIDQEPSSECSSPLDLSGLGEGIHEFRVRAVDDVGNEDATPARQVWTVDLTPPDTAIDAAPAVLSSSASATLAFSASEDGAFECSLDGATFSMCVSPTSYEGLANGGHVFEVRAIDDAGNVDESPAMHRWSIDLQAPMIRFASPRRGTVYLWQAPPVMVGGDEAVIVVSATSTFTLDVDVADDRPGVRVRYLLDGVPLCDGDMFHTCSWSPKSGVGRHVLTAESTDVAGNASRDEVPVLVISRGVV